jgi:glutaredoxin-like YruB-family protein
MSTAKPIITIYSTTSCGFCHAEKQYLEGKGIAFVDKDVEQDENNYNELMEKIGGRENFRGVPVTDINGELVLGFDRAKINKLLNIA